MEKRGVKAMRYLTSDQANELIDALTARAQKAATETVGESTPTGRHADVRRYVRPWDPHSWTRSKTLLKDDLALMKRIKEHLVANGKAKVSDLSHEEALFLKGCLENDTIENFFQRSLVPFDEDGPQPSG